MQLDDKVLLDQFRQPSTKEQGFTAIIKKYQEKLYWHIRRMVIDHDDANDVLQNMFIKVWKGLENFREDSRLYTAVREISEFVSDLGINIPTGKDSLSMTQKYPDGQKVMSTGTVIISTGA